jgi:hypothetical protein
MIPQARHARCEIGRTTGKTEGKVKDVNFRLVPITRASDRVGY